MTSEAHDSATEAVLPRKSLRTDADLHLVAGIQTQKSKCNSDSDSDVNSYRFSKPRIYVKKDYKSAKYSHVEHLKFIAENVGPKDRTPAYDRLINGLLQTSVLKSQKKGKKQEVSINSIDFAAPTLKTASFAVSGKSFSALIDTGSTHCLISVKSFQKLKGSLFTPLRVNMKVAGSVLRDNVVGSTTLLTSFQTNKGIISIPLEFLIAHALNGYEAILGATLLLNPELTSAITPTYLCLTDKFKEAVIPMKRACKKIKANFMLCEKI